MEVFSAILRGEAQKVGGVLELPYYIVGLQEMGRLSPPESITGFSIKLGNWTVLQIMSGDLTI